MGDEKSFEPPIDASPLARGATAIPTMYQGILYRSRLEARWAVFFETLEIRALYEHEAYTLEGGTNYLPDFWLPELATFVEVKPTTPTHDELRKCRFLAMGTQRRVVLVVGAPGAWIPMRGTGFEGGAGEFGYRFWEDGTEDSPYVPCECPGCGIIDWQFDGRADRITCACKKSPHGDRGHNADSERIRRAAQVANAVNLGVR